MDFAFEKKKIIEVCRPTPFLTKIVKQSNNNKEDSNLHTHRRENLKSYLIK
jgi:hypothetical protein